MTSNDVKIEESLTQTVQDNMRTEMTGIPINLMLMMARTGDLVSPWWSRSRDHELRRIVKGSDHLSGAMYTIQSKMTTIPVKIVARDKSIKSHVDMAERMTDILLNASQFGEGWPSLYSRFIEDLFGQDNGAFLEVIGPGDPGGPLTGAPYSIAHLDSCRCTRTGNPLYPVVYTSSDGNLYKLHYTRVMFSSQMPSPDTLMLGVGFSAVSRVIYAAQNLLDIATYKQEKLGSRPARQLFLTGGGLDPEDLQFAFSVADKRMSMQGLSRYSKTIVAGNRSIQKPVLDVIDMAKIPDGFDEKESTILGMAVIAMGFGMDARELFPAMESGATKADAIVQHIKQRGKGPGQTIEITERLLDTKFLPPYLKAVFDYQDDQQDRQAAEIRSVRAQARQRDIEDKITTVRVEREIMVDNGEITEEQFEQMELEDGRLEDGVTVDVLFYSDDKDYKEFLGGVTEGNYENRINEIMTYVVNSRDAFKIKKARRSIAAIQYKFIKPKEKLEQQKLQQEQQKPGKIDDSYEEEKFGRKLGRQEVRMPDEEQNYQA